MRVVLCVAVILLTADARSTLAQTHCSYTKISPTYDYFIRTTEYATKDSDYVGNVSIVIKTKARQKKVGGFTYPIMDGLGPQFNCTSRSYITGYNQNAVAPDGDCGDIVVADLNFDGREDFAIKGEFTNGYGQLYRIYLQDGPGHFREETDLIGRGVEDWITKTFPVEISAKNKTLTFWSTLNAYTDENVVFRYNSTTHKWKNIKESKDIYKNGKVIKTSVKKF